MRWRDFCMANESMERLSPMRFAANQYRSLSPSQLAAAAKLFSSAVIQDLAKKGRSSLFSRLIAESGMAGVVSNNAPIGTLFDSIFRLLRRESYRHEYAYKAAITHKQLLGVHSLRTASMLTEFRVASCKADVAILNGTSTVYEIKSERDKLDRLSAQIDAYRQVFARVNIITGENHLDAILNSIPGDVGVLLLNRQFKITTVRDAINDPSRVNPVTIFESLHRGESIKILQMLGFEVPELPNTQLHAALKNLFKKLDPAETHRCMVQVLKETRSLLPLAELIDQLPRSLQAAAISTPLRKQDHSRLLEAVRTTKEDALRWA